jgi:hypothetical protein
MDHFEVDPGVYEYVHSFGSKISDVDRNFGGYGRQERSSKVNSAIHEENITIYGNVAFYTQHLVAFLIAAALT